ncbi:MAG TPA: hypothetical protein VNO35_10045 [Steroidobacteraceae bacterium]|nr:hypothetical protein [Steroidobacteraceae bacterium]
MFAALELHPRSREPRILAAVQLEQVGIAEDVIQTRGPFQRGDLTEQLLAGARRRDTLDNDLLTGISQLADLQRCGQHSDEERHGNQRQAEEHQSAQ